MEDFSFWWYIIAAIIYFLTRGRKKKQQQKGRPGTENSPPRSQPKSFEDLLREITEGRIEEEPEPEEPVVVKRKSNEEERRREATRLEGERRSFSDAESRKVYEESIKMAEGAELSFEPDESFRESRLFRDTKQEAEDGEEESFAKEIREGLRSNTEVRKAVIYSEILQRKY